MNIIESIGTLTGNAGKLAVSITANTAGSFMKGFYKSFNTQAETEVIVPDQTEQQPTTITTPSQPTQAEFNFNEVKS